MTRLLLKRLAFLACLTLPGLMSPLSAMAAEYTLIVQPIQSADTTRKAYQPLADYLSKATGQKIKLVTAINFVSYWQTMKSGQYDLVLDAAHFTGYRINKMKYVPLAKILNVVSFSLVTHEDNPVLETKELVGKKVALLSSPSLDALRLASLFPNPMRQPIIIRVDDSAQAARMIKEKKVFAAMVPTPMVSAFPFLNTVQTTAQVPHMALSASPRVPANVRQKIKAALLNASQTDAGKALLAKLNLPGFEPATVKQYAGYGKLLRSVFGY